MNPRKLSIIEFTDVISLALVTSFQKIELILIPIIFLFSQVLILLFGLSIIGEETWIVMGIPMMLGAILSVIFLILIIFIVFKLLRMNVNEDNSKKIDKDKKIAEKGKKKRTKQNILKIIEEEQSQLALKVHRLKLT